MSIYKYEYIVIKLVGASEYSSVQHFLFNLGINWSSGDAHELYTGTDGGSFIISLIKGDRYFTNGGNVDDIDRILNRYSLSDNHPYDPRMYSTDDLDTISRIIRLGRNEPSYEPRCIKKE